MQGSLVPYCWLLNNNFDSPGIMKANSDKKGGLGQLEVRIGDVLSGTISGIQPYGAFVALDDDTQGLIHISECCHGYVKSVRDILHVGDVVRVKVLDVDEYSRKVSLSLRALSQDPFTGEHTRSKHYWTNRHGEAGFAPIHNAVPGWLKEAEKDFFD